MNKLFIILFFVLIGIPLNAQMDVDNSADSITIVSPVSRYLTFSNDQFFIDKSGRRERIYDNYIRLKDTFLIEYDTFNVVLFLQSDGDDLETKSYKKIVEVKRAYSVVLNQNRAYQVIWPKCGNDVYEPEDGRGHDCNTSYNVIGYYNSQGKLEDISLIISEILIN
jgi:hypothetical protein